MKANPNKKLMLSFGLFPNSPSGLTFAEGASGAYNSHWTKLATNLVAYNLSSTYLRLGWEFDGNWMAWKASLDPTNWPLYWQQIVTSMRAVPGGNFKFVWCGNLGYVETNAETVYPGSDYVDIVAVDTYDSKYTRYNFL
jgi:beta-mannanase